MSFQNPNELQINNRDGKHISIIVRIPILEAEFDQAKTSLVCRYMSSGGQLQDANSCTPSFTNDTHSEIELLLEGTSLQQQVFAAGSEIKIQINLDNPKFIKSSTSQDDVQFDFYLSQILDSQELLSS